MRTARMFQVFIASTEAWSTGPESHRPLPCTQANSPLERLTPSSRYARPSAVTILLPDTLSSGAAPTGGVVVRVVGGVVVRVVGGVVVGLAVGEVTAPVHVTSLREKAVGTG